MRGEVEERGGDDARHRRRRATKRSATTVLRPKGCDGTPLSSVLLLLPNVPGIDSSSRLQSRSVAFATNIIVFVEVNT